MLTLSSLGKPAFKKIYKNEKICQLSVGINSGTVVHNASSISVSCTSPAVAGIRWSANLAENINST